MLLSLFEIIKHRGIPNLLSIRDRFRKIKRPEIRCFVKECPFWFFFKFESIVSKITSDEVDLISTCPSALAKCPFVKEKWPFIETKSPFPNTIWQHYFILNNVVIFFFFFVWNTFITYFAYMFYGMRCNDAYAKHVNIGCENKKLNSDLIF